MLVGWALTHSYQAPGLGEPSLGLTQLDDLRKGSGLCWGPAGHRSSRAFSCRALDRNATWASTLSPYETLGTRPADTPLLPLVTARPHANPCRSLSAQQDCQLTSGRVRDQLCSCHHCCPLPACSVVNSTAAEACSHRTLPSFLVVPRSLPGVDRNATVEDIKSGYRRMAKTFHPDGTSVLGQEGCHSVS